MKEKLLSLVGSMLLFTLTTHGQSWLTNGLVAYYPLNGNANDASGNGLNGVPYNLTPTTNQLGQPAAAMSFNPTGGSYIDCGSPPLLQFTGDFTITAWVNPLGGTINPRIVGYDGGYFIICGSTNTINGTNTANRNFVFGVGSQYYNEQPVFSAGEWHFVACLVAGSNGYIFVDGAFVATNEYSTARIYSFDLNIGRRSSPPNDNFWGGAMDELRFYNRALSSTEVKQLYTLESFCSPHAAQAIATLSGGGVAGATMTDYGCGYTNSPSVRIMGGGGSNATATANMTGGIVTDLVITSAGSGYTNAPHIFIESPPFVPTVSIAVSKVKVTQHVRVNHNYVLEVTNDFVTWTPTGPSFTAESENIVNEFDVVSVGRYYRLREVP